MKKHLRNFINKLKENSEELKRQAESIDMLIKHVQDTCEHEHVIDEFKDAAYETFHKVCAICGKSMDK